MNRRNLLLSLGAATLGLLELPRQAFSMGGTLPELNVAAPGFTLPGVVPSADGAIEAERSLTDFQGQWLVLYFYPRDFTEGCTIEAKGFQRDLERFHALNAEVVGVSADDTDSHKEFCGSEALSYPLLSDPGGQTSKRYGSWIPPFSQRHTFLIDPEGVLRETWLGVRPLGHSREILKRLEELQAGG